VPRGDAAPRHVPGKPRATTPGPARIAAARKRRLRVVAGPPCRVPWRSRCQPGPGQQPQLPAPPDMVASARLRDLSRAGSKPRIHACSGRAGPGRASPPFSPQRRTWQWAKGAVGPEQPAKGGGLWRIQALGHGEEARRHWVSIHRCVLLLLLLRSRRRRRGIAAVGGGRVSWWRGAGRR
jgi:hypothetical protein